MVAKVGSAAPQIACIHRFVIHAEGRYGFKGGGSRIIEGIGDCPRKGWN
jgi:hypothetical protein